MGSPAYDAQSSELKSISPIEYSGFKPADLSAAVEPDLRWIALHELVVNHEYQRSLSEKSIRSIRRIAENWAWGRVKALTVVHTPEGAFEIIDGQHTAIAASTHGGIDKLPCMVTKGGTIKDRAIDFVAINRDRVNMTALQIFWADVKAEEESAIDVLDGARRAEVDILRSARTVAKMKPGQCVAVGALRRLARRGGVAYVARVLRIGKAAELAPITSAFVQACSLMLWDGYHAEKELNDEAIIKVLRIHGYQDLEERARALAKGPGRFSMKEALALTIARLA